MYLGLKFNFEFKTFFEYYLNQVQFTTCKGTSNFLMQVSQTKFTLWKIMSIKNFSEFMIFFPKGLNPFNIQTRFKLEFVLEFIIQNPERIGSWATKETCSISIYLQPCHVWQFLDIKKFKFCFWKFDHLNSIGKYSR
jgi:hypothetical protein